MKHSLPLSALLLAIALTGCATQAPTVNYTDGSRGARNLEQVTPDIYPTGAKASQEPVIREGRYRLVSTKPSAEQQDLLAQIITFNANFAVHNTVKDALDSVTARSGYRLCPAHAEHIKNLYALPLPEAHKKIGPMTLRNALQVLAGPAFSVEVDELKRSICFTVRSEYDKPIRLAPSVNGEL